MVNAGAQTLRGWKFPRVPSKGYCAELGFSCSFHSSFWRRAVLKLHVHRGVVGRMYVLLAGAGVVDTRPVWVRRTVYGFLVFMAVNGTIVVWILRALRTV